jgi:hypothetical protein
LPEDIAHSGPLGTGSARWRDRLPRARWAEPSRRSDVRRGMLRNLRPPGAPRRGFSAAAAPRAQAPPVRVLPAQTRDCPTSITSAVARIYSARSARGTAKASGQSAHARYQSGRTHRCWLARPMSAGLDRRPAVNDDRNMARRSAATIGVIVGIANLTGRLMKATATGRRAAGDREEAHVNTWKDAWDAGAQSAWTRGASALNPYPYDDSVRTDAWAAGAQWALTHPDRREPSRVRLAHPLRRRTDTSSRLRRLTQAGAVGLSVLAFVRWRRRRARTRDEPNSSR